MFHIETSNFTCIINSMKVKIPMEEIGSEVSSALSYHLMCVATNKNVVNVLNWSVGL